MYLLIFLKTKKTASTSIELLLSKICGKNDIITPVSELTWLGNLRRFEKVTEEDLRGIIKAKPAQNYKGSIFFEIEYFLIQFFRFYINKFFYTESFKNFNRVVMIGFSKYCYIPALF